MKIVLLSLFGCAIFGLGGCLKNSTTSPCTPIPVASEEPQIVAYASANGINATKDSNGLYYEIISQGSGPTPTLTSKIFITYTAKLLNGTLVDQQTNADQTGFILGQLISGWRIGLQYIQKGGRIKLIVPSSLAYGCQGSTRIPPNTILYFDIQLVDVQ
jgi:FKBP-type peptidyl-prolyl cis-trans isomerase FkpA